MLYYFMIYKYDLFDASSVSDCVLVGNPAIHFTAKVDLERVQYRTPHELPVCGKEREKRIERIRVRRDNPGDWQCTGVQVVGLTRMTILYPRCVACACLSSAAHSKPRY